MGRSSRKRSRNGGRKTRYHRRHGGSAAIHCEQQLGIAQGEVVRLGHERDGLQATLDQRESELRENQAELREAKGLWEQYWEIADRTFKRLSQTQAELKEAKELWLHCEDRANEIFAEQGGEGDDDVNRLERLRNEVQDERRLREVARLRAEVRNDTFAGMGRVYTRRGGGNGRKGFSHPKKGKKSRTRRGKKDFTTKKTSHVFDEDSHFVRKGRRPYRKGGKRRIAKKH